MIDFNHYFRPEQHPDAPCVTSDCLARDVIGWPSAQTGLSNCAAGVRIGLVDTAINPDHLAFEARNIEIVRLVEEELPESADSTAPLSRLCLSAQPAAARRA